LSDNTDIFETVCRLLGEGTPLVLASIVGRWGSAPRQTGAKMVVTSGGRGYGTIGGGLMENRVVEEAGAVLDSGSSRIVHFDLDNQDLNTSGMMCGGRADVLLEFIEAGRENAGFFCLLRDSVEEGEDFSLATVFSEDDPSQVDAGHCLLFRDGRLVEQRPLPQLDLELLKASASSAREVATVRLKDRRALLEPVQKARTLYCFGAGHVAVPTARIASIAGFHVMVLDDRAEFACEERFPEAAIRIVDDFSRSFDGLEIDRNSFIVIVTREHLFDRIVLEQALKTDAGYIGMISSRKKRDAIFRVLLEAGAKEEDLRRVHSPIGLDISAETPEEIAVSIVAELVQERARQRR
jgi:xanthine dehydrogenase accessory factor